MLFFLVKLLMVFLNNVLLRVDILGGFSSFLFFWSKFIKDSSSIFFTKEVPKERFTEVSLRLLWISKLMFGENLECIG